MNTHEKEIFPARFCRYVTVEESKIVYRMINEKEVLLKIQLSVSYPCFGVMFEDLCSTL